MNNIQNPRGIIWTNHALERLNQRGLTKNLAYQTFKDPYKTSPAKSGALEYIRFFGKSKVTVIAKKNDRDEWLILSCFIDPPLYDTKDYYQRKDYIKFKRNYKKAGFWGKFWLELKKQLGI